jgi:hypothetical protein
MESNTAPKLRFVSVRSGQVILPILQSTVSWFRFLPMAFSCTVTAVQAIHHNNFLAKCGQGEEIRHGHSRQLRFILNAVIVRCAHSHGEHLVFFQAITLLSSRGLGGNAPDQLFVLAAGESPLSIQTICWPTLKGSGVPPAPQTLPCFFAPLGYNEATNF